ncbi:hypothetical protein BD779DRAFT_239777 [Infundibulicybe gibba]|nr:hypothetical protein BD779DRAFT_239777 [Infundibulicybe gibba]
MKLAITGCNGRVGKCVVRCALAAGHAVVGIDRSVSNTAVELGAQFVFVKADLREYAEVLEALRGCNGVVHLAAMPQPDGYKVNTHNNNVVLSWNVLTACAEVSHPSRQRWYPNTCSWGLCASHKHHRSTLSPWYTAEAAF